MATLGGACSDRASNFGGDMTYLSPYEFTTTGNVTSVCVYSNRYLSNGTICAMFFRPNGSNWDYIGESDTQSLTNDAAQAFTLNCNVDVQSGDRIGWYTSTTGQIEETDSGGLTYKRTSGKQTGTNISFGTTLSSRGDVSILATYNIITTFDNVFVNSSTGDDMKDGTSAANAKKTFASAYSILNANGTIHVMNAGADFSGETISFTKALSIVGTGSGFYLSQFT
ncbi:MAG: hypothetical protein FIB08_03675 [Candidatus Methanoperedens sp.]|nr:hypothetical protein [Candidatus Methanoperedens sp.]